MLNHLADRGLTFLKEWWDEFREFLARCVICCCVIQAGCLWMACSALIIQHLLPCRGRITALLWVRKPSITSQHSLISANFSSYKMECAQKSTCSLIQTSFPHSSPQPAVVHMPGNAVQLWPEIYSPESQELFSFIRQHSEQETSLVLKWIFFLGRTFFWNLSRTEFLGFSLQNT